MGIDPNQLSQDKTFLAMSAQDQTGYLSSQDPDFAKMTPADQAGYISHLTGKPVQTMMTAPNAGLAPPAGYQPPLTPAAGAPVFEGESTPPKYANAKTHLVGPSSPTIMKAPEESGLETGPLHANNPAENNTWTHGGESARFLARAAHAAGEALNPFTQIPAMFHAAVDQPQDAQQAQEEEQVSAMNPMAPPFLTKFLHRTVTKPTVTAIQDYAAGRFSPEQIMSASPEGLGGAGGTVIGGKMLDKIIGAATDAATAAAERNGGFLPRSIAPRSPVHDIVADTYSKTGDHLAASLRSNTKVDVPAEAKIAAPAIREGLADRGIATGDFEGRNGPTAFQTGIDNAIDIHEARAKSVIDPIRGEKVDPQVLEENPELAARFQGRKNITYGDIDAERIKMNKELRTSNFYSKPPSAQYAVGDPLANLHEAANQARDLVYDKAGETTGVNLHPLKRTESALIKLGDLAETTKNTLSPKEAQFNTASLKSKIGGSVKGLISAKANPANAFSIPEKVGLSSPLNEFNSHMRNAFPNLQAVVADRSVAFPRYNLSLTSPGTMPGPVQQILNLSGGENIPGQDLRLTPPGDMPPALQRVLGFENPGVPSETYPGVAKVRR